MRILILDEWLPIPMDSGKRLRSYELLRRLAGSHDLTWLSPQPDTPDMADQARGIMSSDGFCVETVRAPVLKRSDPRLYLNALGSMLSPVPYVVALHRSRALMDRMAELHRHRPFDLLHVEWTPLAANRPEKWNTPWVVDAHNLEARIWGRMAQVASAPHARVFFSLEARRMAAFERKEFQAADAVIAVSELERAEIQQLGGRASTVENGVDLEAFRPTGAEERQVLLFTGALDWRANVDAVEHFVRDLWPGVAAACPGWKFQVVGRNPDLQWKARMESAPGVEVHGSVPSIKPFLEKASVVVVPLRAGGGTRLKILEALAMEKAVVSTSIGAEGLEIVPGEDFLVASSPGEWVSAIHGLAASPTRRAALGASGRRRIEPRYGWDGLSQKLERVWLGALERRGSP